MSGPPGARQRRRILVAGGAGFIGVTLCRRLLARGDEVICVDNLLTGRRAHVIELAALSGFSFVEADVCHEFPDPGPLDAVVNLACPASPVDFGPLAREILDAGSRGTGNLVDLAVARAARFVQASTSEVYGDPACHPQPETYFGNVNPLGPRAPYDESKRFSEALVMTEHRRGANVGIARIFNTYGPGMRLNDGRVVSEFVARALRGEPLTVHGDGSQTRSLCYVDDLVTGLINLLDSSHVGPINLGTDDEWRMVDLARLIIELTGSSSEVLLVERPPDDPARRRPDLTLAHRLIGWAPPTSLRQGLTATIAWSASSAAR